MKICLDAGHYKGYNQGVVKNYYEGNIVWKLTNLQKKYLEKYKDVTVVLTRSDISKDLALSSRGAKAKGCDLFISNHSNSVDNSYVDRAVIIYPYDNKNSSSVLGKKLGKVITDTMGLKQAYQMYQRTYNGGEHYGVMRAARSAGCPRYYILEHGFHTNKAVCNWLLKDENLEKLAKAEVEAIAEYYGLKKKNTSTSTVSEHKRIVGSIKVISDTLNIRKSSSFDSAIVGKLNKGDIVQVMAKENGLYKIKEGQWCSAGDKYVKFTEEKSAVYEVTTETLNVRNGRGVNFREVGELHKGDRVAIWTISEDSKNEKWGSFRYSFTPNVVGYIHMGYLKKVS